MNAFRTVVLAIVVFYVVCAGPRFVLASDSCPADVDGNGRVEFPDALTVLTLWGTPDPLGDIDGSGTVDWEDMAVLLDAWGPCAVCGNGELEDGEECEDDGDCSAESECRACRCVEPSSGWTEFSPSADTQIIHVSSSTGSNSNDGSEQRPLRSISAGVSRLRDGKPDWLLLRRGDTWNEGLGGWSKSGRSADEQVLISYYGSDDAERPILRSTTGIQPTTGAQASHVAIVGLHFQSAGNCVDAYNSRARDWLIEDCRLQGGEHGVMFNSTDEDQPIGLSIRRCVVVDCGKQGIYVSRYTDLVLEDNIIDDNGTSDTHEHDIYINKGVGTLVRNNIITRGSNFGLKFRGGQTDGVITGNVISRNRNGVVVHTKYEGEVNINIEFTGNLVLDNGHDGQLIGLSVSGTQHMLIADNIITHTAGGYHWNGPAITFGFAQYYDGNGDWPQLLDVTVRNNTFLEYEQLFMQFGDDVPYSDFVITRNLTDGPTALVRHRTPLQRGDISYAENVYNSSRIESEWFVNGDDLMSFGDWVDISGEEDSLVEDTEFADDTQTLGSYNDWLGGGDSFEAFIAEARKQSRQTWNEDYTAEAVIAYFRDGLTPLNLNYTSSGEHYGAVEY